MNTTLLLILAVAPPIAFMYFIYWMDRYEPESLRTIMMAMFIGALSIIPAVIIQLVSDPLPLFQIGGLTGAFYESFIQVAPSEEFSKFIFIYLFIRKKPFYNEINDGIVYYGAGAIGFALLENIFYVFDYGFTIGILRAFTSIPIHTFCGVIVGYHVGLARFTDQPKPTNIIIRGLFLAYFTHALFNTLVSAENFIMLLFIPLIITVYLIGYRTLRSGRRLSLSGREAAKNLVLPPAIPFPAIPFPAIPPPAIPFPVMPPPVMPLVIPAPPAIPVVVGPAVRNYRWEEVVTDSDGKKYLPPKREVWKAFLSRTLFVIIGLLWLLAFIGAETPPSERWNLVLGMILITIIPAMLGLLLELSYQRRKRIRIYID